MLHKTVRIPIGNLDADVIHDALIKNVPNFQRTTINSKGEACAVEDSGGIMWDGKFVIINFAEDVPFSSIASVLDTFDSAIPENIGYGTTPDRPSIWRRLSNLIGGGS